MLPESISGVYDRYKRDTVIIASWLVQTAKSLGFDGDLAQVTAPKSQPKSSGRLKGKARKEAKKAEASGASKPPQPAQPRRKYEHVLAIQDFVPLAEFIAAVTKPKPVSVPEFAASALQRVIRARQSFSGLLRRAGKAVDVVTDEKHSVFVGILEKVQDILAPLMAPQELREKEPRETGGTRPKDLTSLFEYLTVYEPSEEFLNAPDVENPAPEYAPEEEDSLEAAAFACVTLMRDVSLVLDLVRQLWEFYADGSFDIAAASVATSTAISLVRRMEEDYLPLMKKHGGAGKFLQVYYAGLCLADGKDILAKERPGDDINFDTYDLADECMFTTYLFLEAFSRVPSRGEFQNYNGLYGYYDPSIDRESASNRLKYRQDKAALLELLPDCVTVGGTARGLFKTMNPCIDDLSRGVGLMVETGEIPLWLVFAAQAFLEALRPMAGSVELLEKSFEDMMAWNSAIESSISTALKYSRCQKLKTKDWGYANDVALRGIIQTTKFWSSDPIGKLKSLGGLPSEPFIFLKRHPHYCGLWIHMIRQRYHEAGVALAGASGSILYAGQLYHALMCENLASPWSDMDFLFQELRMSEPGGFFVGDRPYDPETHFENFCLSMGYPSGDWSRPPNSRNARSFKPAKPTAAAHCLKELGPVSALFKGRFSGEASRTGLTADDLSKIADAAARNFNCCCGGEHDPVVLLNERETGADGGQRKGNGRRRVVNFDSLIRGVAIAVHKEVIGTSLDFFTLHRTSSMFLDSLHLDADSKRWFGLGYLQQERQLPHFVGYIFMAMAGKVEHPTADDLMELLRNDEDLLPTGFTGSKALRHLEDMGIQISPDFSWGPHSYEAYAGWHDPVYCACPECFYDDGADYYDYEANSHDPEENSDVGGD